LGKSIIHQPRLEGKEGNEKQERKSKQGQTNKKKQKTPKRIISTKCKTPSTGQEEVAILKQIEYNTCTQVEQKIHYMKKKTTNTKPTKEKIHK